MNLPTPEQCYALWDTHEMLDNIKEHSRQVGRVARRVAEHIKAQGVVSVDVDLAESGAFLHDIAKSITIQKGGSHSKMGRKIVLEEGYSEALGNVVLKHGLNVFGEGLTIEEQIVNYADKRVRHDEIVTLEERFEDLKKRYADKDGTITAKQPLFEEFEKKYHLETLAVWR